MIQQVLGSYYGYVEGKRKEDDLAVKRKIMDEIKKAKNNLFNIMEEFDDVGDYKSVEATKKVMDELDMFHTDVDLSEAGHRFPFFSTQKSANKKQIEKLVDFDQSLIAAVENVTKASEIINNKLLDEELKRPVKELKKVRQYVSNGRNHYKDRRDFIKNIK